MAAGKDAAALARKRTEEITLALRASDLTPAGYIETAFQFPEVERLEVHSFPPGTWQPAKIEELQPGFDADNVESYLLEKHGAARYRFSAIVGKKSFAWRVYTLGDVREDLAHPNGHGDATAVTTGQAVRDVAAHLKSSLDAAQLSNLMADLEASRANRELAPARLMIDMMGQVLGRLGAPNPGNDRIVELLIDQLKDLKAELREQRQPAAAAAAPTGAAGVAKLADDIKAVMSAGELLGLTKPSGAAAVASPWTPDAVKTTLEAAAPVLNRVLDMVQFKLAGGAPGGPAQPALPAPGGKPVAEPQPLDPAAKEQFDFLIESLRSRDFTTVAWMVHTLLPDVVVDPDVNPLAYVMALKRIDPRFNDLRGEIADFLKFVREHRPPEASA